MTKAEIRTQFLARRKALSAHELQRRSQLITDLFLDELKDKSFDSQTLHVFLPIIRQSEVNTWLIIHRIWSERPDIQVAVSITDTVQQSLTHYSLTLGTTLVENRWGIPEPLENRATVIKSDAIDLVLVPLLAFDKQGHRVGYGGGYYDRFLVQCRPDCLKIGLSLFEPVDEIEGVEPTDIRLDGCITPEAIYRFQS